MNKNLVVFFISLVMGSLLFLSYSFIEKKEALKPEVSKLQIASFSPDKSIFSTFVFQRIPAGSFVMGSPKSERYRDPFRRENQVEVTISKPFEMMITEVTQYQWFLVMGYNPSLSSSRVFRFENCERIRIDEVYICPEHPVNDVSWDEVQTFIRKLNHSLGLTGCNGTPQSFGGCYRLPTEAEWEWAARAGTKTAYFFGDDASVLGSYAWYEGNTHYKIHMVKQKKPNPWGLYDIYGNVWELVQDSYREDLPGGEDPLVADGNFFVVRGGDYNEIAKNLRSAKRGRSPWTREEGFRLVRTLGGDAVALLKETSGLPTDYKR